MSLPPPWALFVLQTDALVSTPCSPASVVSVAGSRAMQFKNVMLCYVMPASKIPNKGGGPVQPLTLGPIKAHCELPCHFRCSTLPRLTACRQRYPMARRAHWWACASSHTPTSAEPPLLHRPAEVCHKAGACWSNAQVVFTGTPAGSTDICTRHRRWIATTSAHHCATWRHRCARGSSRRVRRAPLPLPSGTTLRLARARASHRAAEQRQTLSHPTHLPC